MIDVLSDRASWYVVGVALGLVVVGVMAVLGERVGAVGGYSEVVDRVTGRSPALGWRAWFLFGIVGGSALFTVLGGDTAASDGYGWLSRTFDGSAAFLVGPILFCAGILIGYGAKTAGGCTSGNGLCGSALGSRSSLVATATFMATAVTLALTAKAVF
jgi:uncharacterized membrane protein YedE/YeeE